MMKRNNKICLGNTKEDLTNFFFLNQMVYAIDVYK